MIWSTWNFFGSVLSSARNRITWFVTRSLPGLASCACMMRLSDGFLLPNSVFWSSFLEIFGISQGFRQVLVQYYPFMS